MKLGFLLWLASALPNPAADQLCLATTVYLEARSESQAGQMAVAEVAMRRREEARRDVSVCDVVKARGQFALSTTSPNANLHNPDAWAKAWQVASRSIRMWSLPPDRRHLLVPHADHFVLADSTMPDWIKGPPLATIGAHNFYRIN